MPRHSSKNFLNSFYVLYNKVQFIVIYSTKFLLYAEVFEKWQ